MYGQAIPRKVTDQIPAIIAGITDAPIAVSISSFGNEGEVEYALEVHHSPRFVEQTDKRVKDFTEFKAVTIFLSAEGNTMDRADSSGSLPGRVEGAPTITSEELEEEKAAARLEQMKELMENV